MRSDELDKIIQNFTSTAILTWGRTEEGEGPPDESGVVPPKKVVAQIAYSMKGFGFGELTFYTDEKGQSYIDTECSSRETVMKILKLFVDGAILDHDTDPKNHRKYNSISGTTCGESCKICNPTKEGP